MENKKKSTKRRSWKKDYLSLEKKHKNLIETKVKLEETVNNLLNSNDQMSQHLDQLVEEADKLRKDRSAIKTRIHQIINKKKKILLEWWNVKIKIRIKRFTLNESCN